MPSRTPKFEETAEKFRSISQLSYVSYDNIEPPTTASVRRERLLQEAATLRSHSPKFVARSNSEISYAEEKYAHVERVSSMKPPHRLTKPQPFTSNSTSRISYAAAPAEVTHNSSERARRPFETITPIPFTALSESRRNLVPHKVAKVERRKEAHRPLRTVKFDAVTTSQASYR